MSNRRILLAAIVCASGASPLKQTRANVVVTSNAEAIQTSAFSPGFPPGNDARTLNTLPPATISALAIGGSPGGGFIIASGTLTIDAYDGPTVFGAAGSTPNLTLHTSCILPGGGGAAGAASMQFKFDLTAFHPFTYQSAVDPLIGPQGNIPAGTGLLSPGSYTYKFAYNLVGMPMKLDISAAIPTPHPGDANADGHVNQLDFTALAQHFNQSGATWDKGNFNADTVTNALDFNILSTNYGFGATSPAAAVGGSMVPEPATSALLATAGAFAIRRRRGSA